VVFLGIPPVCLGSPWFLEESFRAEVTSPSNRCSGNTPVERIYSGDWGEKYPIKHVVKANYTLLPVIWRPAL
jgi:hypothetical protein